MVAVDNPILARRFRGGVLESIHRGAWAVVDTDGQVRANAGDPDQLIFARSASKSLQQSGVLPLGVVDRFGLTPAHIAVMISSHNGQASHVATVQSLLDAMGLTEGSLQCGDAYPMGHIPLEGPPHLDRRRICHNCSGKHAGFLSGALVLDQHPTTYLDPASPIQQSIRAAVQRLTDTPDEHLHMAVDGCSAPTFILPLRGLGAGIARIANPESLTGDDHASASAMAAAAAAHPDLVAGDEPMRFDTAVMQATAGRIFAKGGADGVRTLGVRGAGVAFVGKVDDGNDRGLNPVAVGVLHALGYITDAEVGALGEFVDPSIRNAAGLMAGEQRLEPFGL